MQETERRRLAADRRHEPLLERDQTQVPQHPVRARRRWCLVRFMCSDPSCRWRCLPLKSSANAVNQFAFLYLKENHSFFGNSLKSHFLKMNFPTKLYRSFFSHSHLLSLLTISEVTTARLSVVGKVRT